MRSVLTSTTAAQPGAIITDAEPTQLTTENTEPYDLTAVVQTDLTTAVQLDLTTVVQPNLTTVVQTDLTTFVEPDLTTGKLVVVVIFYSHDVHIKNTITKKKIVHLMKGS